MHIAVCLDDRDGMLFNKRRLSADRAVTARLLEMTGDGCLWMNGYSGKLFAEDDRLRVAEDFLEQAAQGDICLVENVDITRYKEIIKKLTVFRWNRVYPADVKFPMALFPEKQLVSRTEFAGNSHERITQEDYVL